MVDLTKDKIIIQPDMALCQSDYPLDWYQEALVPYAEEYLALPDRKISTIVPWMEKYIQPARDYFGDSLLLLSHYYMGGEIVKLMERFGGVIGDSYELALMSAAHPEKKIIIESAVHFMAESIATLANPDQRVFITNPKSGCTMEMLAKDFMVEPAFLELNDRYGKDNIIPICYMNTSGRVKAMAGAQGGAVCTSSNVEKIFRWALAQDKKILFIPDQHMGENVASWVGIPPEKIAYWPAGPASSQFNLAQQDDKIKNSFDNAQLILFQSHCGVHTHYQPAMAKYWQERNYHVVVHPECKKIMVDAADSCGSTRHIWDMVTNDKAGTKRYAIGTENHMVMNLKAHCVNLGIEVVNLAEAPIKDSPAMGCGCATMSRNDPPHLVGLLDCLRKGINMSANEVKPGDMVNEMTGHRERLNQEAQDWVVENAKRALEKMIEISQA